MYFLDETEITIRSGAGGDGCVAFLREKFRPKGGPAGGDGGHGGNVILRATRDLDTLLPLARQRNYAAESGRPGEGKNCHGRTGEDLIIEVPVGTVVYDRETGQQLADLPEHDDRALVAEGGRGGRGNSHFKSPTNQTPRVAETGDPGQERHLRLELKLLADVGLVGKPNAGKSTLISRLSAARPEIADYPFTTRSPALGIVDYGEYRQFVMADIPGLIEGAHAGAGLGHQFLRHIERTRVILHLVDLLPPGGEAPAENYRAIREELGAFNPALLERPEVVVGTKMDLPGAPEALKELREAVGDRPVLGISAVAGTGLKKLVARVGEQVAASDAEADDAKP